MELPAQLRFKSSQDSFPGPDHSPVALNIFVPETNSYLFLKHCKVKILPLVARHSSGTNFVVISKLVRDNQL